jgi:hypothetical protein
VCAHVCVKYNLCNQCNICYTSKFYFNGALYSKEQNVSFQSGLLAVKAFFCFSCRRMEGRVFRITLNFSTWPKIRKAQSLFENILKLNFFMLLYSWKHFSHGYNFAVCVSEGPMGLIEVSCKPPVIFIRFQPKL